MRVSKATGPSSRHCGMVVRFVICWDKSVPAAQAKGSSLAPTKSLPQLICSTLLSRHPQLNSTDPLGSPTLLLLQHYHLKGNQISPLANECISWASPGMTCSGDTTSSTSTQRRHKLEGHLDIQLGPVDTMHGGRY